MQISLYNTMSRRHEALQPIDPKNVRMYVCGPTVYDRAHIGNARPVVVFDTLFRLLRHAYGEQQVTYVRNITDVEDKIIAAAAENSESIDALTQRTTEAYHADMAALNALAPTQEPRATSHIAGMVTMIGQLIERGHAYVAQGHVLFDVPSMQTYGELSRRSLDDMIAGARVEVAPYKKSAADFVLWKPGDAAQPGWDSPWGRGRPGWHIECSAMAEAAFGVTFDIHGGGIDLIFPHHENEIAQSVCAHDGAPLANLWMHNGFVQVNGEKMSKSLGNFFTVRDLLDESFKGEAIRLALLSAHYRQPLDFTREGLREATQQLDRFYLALKRADDGATGHAQVQGQAPPDLLAALADDLNTPLALSHLHEAATRLNRATDPDDMAKGKAELLAGGALLGLLQQRPVEWLQAASGKGLSAEEIEALIAERIAARKTKDFARADQIRDDLLKRGVVLEDGPKGTSWRRSGA
jgi:cysteinyl-tRNA synthetase